MSTYERIAMNEMSLDDWAFMLELFSDVKAAEIVGCDVSTVAAKRKELGL